MEDIHAALLPLVTELWRRCCEQAATSPGTDNVPATGRPSTRSRQQQLPQLWQWQSPSWRSSQQSPSWPRLPVKLAIEWRVGYDQQSRRSAPVPPGLAHDMRRGVMAAARHVRPLLGTRGGAAEGAVQAHAEGAVAQAEAVVVGMVGPGPVVTSPPPSGSMLPGGDADELLARLVQEYAQLLQSGLGCVRGSGRLGGGSSSVEPPPSAAPSAAPALQPSLNVTRLVVSFQFA
jgi:hypothetical protein